MLENTFNASTKKSIAIQTATKPFGLTFFEKFSQEQECSNQTSPISAATCTMRHTATGRPGGSDSDIAADVDM